MNKTNQIKIATMVLLTIFAMSMTAGAVTVQNSDTATVCATKDAGHNAFLVILGVPNKVTNGEYFTVHASIWTNGRTKSRAPYTKTYLYIDNVLKQTKYTDNKGVVKFTVKAQGYDACVLVDGITCSPRVSKITVKAVTGGCVVRSGSADKYVRIYNR